MNICNGNVQFLRRKTEWGKFESFPKIPFHYNLIFLWIRTPFKILLPKDPFWKKSKWPREYMSFAQTKNGFLFTPEMAQIVPNQTHINGKWSCYWSNVEIMTEAPERINEKFQSKYSVSRPANFIYNSINNSMNQKDDIESLLCYQIMEWFITYPFDTVYLYQGIKEQVC